MATWGEIERAVPELASEVRSRFAVGKHSTLATIRADGAPRISGTEVEFDGNQVRLGSMPGARKALDLRRDPRFALHSPSVDPPADNPSAWPGEAKLAGIAVETSDPQADDDAHHFDLDVREVVVTRVVGNRLEIRSWHEGRGYQVRTRD